MQLIDLVIVRGGAVVRSIAFKDGLNLILDKPTGARTESGNNVGKTTLLRLIDFCLGSQGSDIWEDAEFKNTVNQEVYDFLHGAVPVSIALQVEKTVGRTQKERHTLKRQFGGRQPGGGRDTASTFFVDATGYKKLDDYRQAVKYVLFGSQGAKPTLRQLAPKFVRSSPVAMSKTLKFLGEYGSEAAYEAVHLFLFGFFDVQVLEDRPRLVEQRKKLERDLQALTRIRKEGEIEQLLLHLQREVEAISLSNQLRGEVPEIAEHANAVSSIRSEAASLAGSLGRIDGEIASLRLTIGELQSEFSDIDRQAIEAIYREAQNYIPKLHHDWNELTNFVQNLRGRKQRFLEIQVTDLQKRATDIQQRLQALRSRESQEIGTLMKSRAFNQALEVRADLQQKLKQLGGLEQDLKHIRELKGIVSNVDQQLQETKQKIDESKALLQKRVAIFNKYFSALSEALYGEKYLLHFEESPRGSITFELTAVGSNVGAGKKMSQTAAFDLAYIRFLRDAKINFPQFVCHDGVESIHGNQLNALLTTANEVGGQLVLATLRDKLPKMATGYIKKNTVLELSQEDKLFRI